jgi:hypothetical protein
MGFAQEFIASAPSSSFGYYRGTPYYGGEGSGGGQNVAGNSAFAQGQGPGAATGWEPSIFYLLGFVVLEMIVFGILATKI